MNLFILLILFGYCSSQNLFQRLESASNALILIKIPDNSSHLEYQIKDMLRGLHYDPYIKLIKQQCNTNKCDSITLFNPQGEQIQKITLPSSMIRLKQLLKKHIEEQNVKIKTQFKELKQIQHIQNRARIVQIHQQIQNLKKEDKSYLQEEWQKAQFPNRSSSNNKKKQQNNLINVETKLNKPQSSVNAPPKKQNQQNKFQKIQNLYWWYLLYLAITIGVISGMKYLNSEEQRMYQAKLCQNERWEK